MSTGRAIDHIGIASRNLDGLVQQYEAAGFTLTPRAFHPDHMGTSNQLVQFQGRNFLELIEIDRPDGVTPLSPGIMSFGAYTQDFLTRREGINLIVFRTDDRDADLSRWRGLGLDTYEPFNFERLATLPDGTQQTVRFELGFVTHPDIDCLFFVCHNKAEEHFWKPDFQAHANGGTAIEAAVLASDDPGRDAMFLSALFGGEISPRGCCMSVSCGEHRIDVVSAKRLTELGWAGDLSHGSQAAGIHLNGAAARRRVAAEEAGNCFIQWTG